MKKNTATQKQFGKGTSKTGSRGQGVNLASSKSYVAPRISSKSDKTTLVKSEFIMNLVPSGEEFEAHQIVLNPGNSLMFPWLSTISDGWEKFKVKKIRFEYKTAQSTLVPGMVMFAPEFNVEAPLPDSKQDLLEYMYAKRCAIWENISMDIAVSSVMNYKDYYIRTGSSDSQSPLLFDPMYLIWATDAVSTDVEYIGELWVHYEIEMLLPQRVATEVRNYSECRSFVFTQGTNEQPFTDLLTTAGGLACHLVDGQDIAFDEAFAGMAVVALNGVGRAGMGTATAWRISTYDEYHPIIWQSSGEHDPVFTDGAGGFSGSDTVFENSSIVYFMFLKQEAGSVLRCASVGLPAETGTQVSVTVSFIRSLALNPYAGFVPSAKKPRTDPFLLKERRRQKASIRDPGTSIKPKVPETSQDKPLPTKVGNSKTLFPKKN
jgi:hypothetical protein